MQNELNDLISSFVELPTEEKPKEIINELKNQVALAQDLCNKFGVEEQMLLNREMADVNKENPTIDDYFEAIYAYSKTLEDCNGRLLNRLSDILQQYMGE